MSVESPAPESPPSDRNEQARLSDRRRGRRRTSVPARLTARGWGWVVLCVMLAGVGRWAHEPALMHMALLGACVLAAAWPVAVWNLRGLEYSRRVPTSVFVGREFIVEVRLKNARRGLSARAIDVSDEILGPFGKGMSVHTLPPGAIAGEMFQVWLRQRAVDPSFRWRLTSSFPFGLWRVGRSGRSSESLVVYPRPVVPAGLEDPNAGDIDTGDENWLPQPDYTGEYLGIRDFQSGDPLKLIHWRAAARVQRLVVREFDRRLPAHFALFFHSWHPPGQARLPDGFESALELLAGLLIQCRSIGVPLELTADFYAWKTISLGGSDDLNRPLKALAEAKWSPSTDLNPVIEALSRVPVESRVFIVSDTPVRLWQNLLPKLECAVDCLSVGEMRRKNPAQTFHRRA